MDVPVSKAHPQGYQQENWLLGPGRWKKVRHMAPNELTQFTDLTSSLWIDGDSSCKGQNDRIPCRSLYLIKVDRLELFVSQPGINFGNDKTKVQGRFRYNERDYWLQITDHDYEKKYQEKGNGCYQRGKCFLTISLTAKPFDNSYVYKLIAAVIEP